MYKTERYLSGKQEDVSLFHLSESTGIFTLHTVWSWLNSSESSLEEINPDRISGPRDNKGNKVLCEMELRAPESQNSIPAKSRFSSGWSRAVGTPEAPPRERVSGGLCLYRAGPAAPRAQTGNISLPFSKMRGNSVPFCDYCWHMGSDTSSQSP